MSNVVNSYRFGGAAPSFSFNNALLFDGVNDYLDFPNYTSSMPSTHSFSCWVNTVDIGNFNATVGLCAADITNVELKVQSSLSRIQYRLFTVTKTWTIPALSNNTWYHIVMSMDALSTRVYVNGTESSTGALTHTVGGSATQNIVNVGRNYNGTDYVDGKIDEWGLWYNYALTASDVTTLYNSGNGSSVADISPSNLWAGSHHDETAGNTTANLGTGGTISLINFPVDDSQWVTH